jgi:hypothetical protein
MWIRIRTSDERIWEAQKLTDPDSDPEHWLEKLYKCAPCTLCFRNPATVQDFSFKFFKISIMTVPINLCFFNCFLRFTQATT